MAPKGSALKGALAAAPRGGRVTSLPVGKPPAPSSGVTQGVDPRAGLQRLSPGVYRNPQGQLVNSRGGSLPGQRQQQRSPYDYYFAEPQQPRQGVGTAIGALNPQQPQYRQPAQLPGQFMPGKIPQAGGGMMYAGGTPNFDESTGQYRPGYKPGQMTGGFAPQQPVHYSQVMPDMGTAFGNNPTLVSQEAAAAARAAQGQPLSPEQRAAMLAQQQAYAQQFDQLQQPQQSMMPQAVQGVAAGYAGAFKG